MSRGKVANLLLLSLILLIVTGCRYTMFKYYAPIKKQDSRIEFQGYRIKYDMEASDYYSTFGTDSFRINIEVEYPSQIRDSAAFDSTNILKIDSVCVRYPGSDEKICADIETYRPPRILGFCRLKVSGPNYSFSRIYIPAIYPNIELEFRVGLFDGNTGRIISTAKFVRKLFRSERKWYY